MPPVFKGKDDRGNSIGTNVTFWKAVKEGAKAPDGKPLWYKKGIEYWDAVEATDDGVLGGYGHVSTQDAIDNTAFLETVFGDALEAKKTGSRKLVACDCGAGIGRVTSSFLIHQFDEVDLVVRRFICFFKPHVTSEPPSTPWRTRTTPHSLRPCLLEPENKMNERRTPCCMFIPWPAFLFPVRHQPRTFTFFTACHLFLNLPYMILTSFRRLVIFVLS